MASSLCSTARSLLLAGGGVRPEPVLPGGQAPRAGERPSPPVRPGHPGDLLVDDDGAPGGAEPAAVPGPPRVQPRPPLLGDGAAGGVPGDQAALGIPADPAGVGVVLGPGVGGRAVPLPDVIEHPGQLRPGVGPAGGLRGERHLRRREGLRDAVRAGAGVTGEPVVPGFVHFQGVERGPLGCGPREHAPGQGLIRPRVTADRPGPGHAGRRCRLGRGLAAASAALSDVRIARDDRPAHLVLERGSSCTCTGCARSRRPAAGREPGDLPAEVIDGTRPDQPRGHDELALAGQDQLVIGGRPGALAHEHAAGGPAARRVAGFVLAGSPRDTLILYRPCRSCGSDVLPRNRSKSAWCSSWRRRRHAGSRPDPDPPERGAGGRRAAGSCPIVRMMNRRRRGS